MEKQGKSTERRNVGLELFDATASNSDTKDLIETSATNNNRILSSEATVHQATSHAAAVAAAAPLVLAAAFDSHEDHGAKPLTSSTTKSSASVSDSCTSGLLTSPTPSMMNTTTASLTSGETILPGAVAVGGVRMMMTRTIGGGSSSINTHPSMIPEENSTQGESPIVATAETVNDEELLQRAEENILSRAALAEVIDTEEESSNSEKMIKNEAGSGAQSSKVMLFLGGLLLTALILIVGFPIVLTGGSTNASSRSAKGVLEVGTIIAEVDATDENSFDYFSVRSVVSPHYPF